MSINTKYSNTRIFNEYADVAPRSMCFNGVDKQTRAHS